MIENLEDLHVGVSTDGLIVSGPVLPSFFLVQDPTLLKFFAYYAVCLMATEENLPRKNRKRSLRKNVSRVVFS